MNGLTKKYGLFTAIAMVVGIVVGSGIFFKTESILAITGGNMPIGLIAFIVGGLIMIICANAFAVMSTKYEKVNGLVDYAEATCGKGYAYMLGWYSAVMYFPSLTSVLAWVSARYFCELIGIENARASSECMLFAGLFLILAFVLNTLSPKLSGKFQVSTTIIKMIPLLLMAVIGTVVGLTNGNTVESFKTISVVPEGNTVVGIFFAALIASAFAYEGWIVTTSINAELKNAKRNLPIALTAGSLIVVLIYICYYIGVTGGATITELSTGGSVIAFKNIFGTSIGKILTGFIVISCLGTLNGLMLGCSRAFFAIASRGEGPSPKALSEVSASTNMPYHSSIIALLLCGFWLVYFYGANLVSPSWFGVFTFDSSEVPIITIYLFYIPILANMIRKAKELSFVKRFIILPLALLCSVFMIYAMIDKFKMAMLYFGIIFVVIMLVGAVFYFGKKPEKKIQHKQKSKKK